MIKKTAWTLAAIFCTLTFLGGGAVWAQENLACGDNQMVCGTNEKCCQHPQAVFCEGNTCSSVHVEGQCIPKEQACGDFWCGNRHCQASWLLSKNVCCIFYQQGQTPEYSCASSELSCPGNSAQLTIRPTVASRHIHGK